MGKLEDLQKLKELKESGVLTEEEYEIEKYNVLNSDDSKDNNKKNEKKSKKATVGFILGLCSIIAWYIPIIGFPVTVLGIIFSAIGLNSKNNSFAIAGLILSIIFFIITLMNSIAGAVIMSNYFSNY